MYCELASYIFPLLCFDRNFFGTFRELGTSIFTLNNLKKESTAFQTRVYFL